MNINILRAGVISLIVLAGCDGRSVGVSSDGGTGDARADAGCPPPGESVRVDFSLQDGVLVIRATNVGCGPVYRLTDCCGPSPLAEIQVTSAGAWQRSSCSEQANPCRCAAEPSCKVALRPGQSQEVRRSAAECSCPGGTLRAAVGFHTDPSCRSGFGYFSNTLTVGCAGH